MFARAGEALRTARERVAAVRDERKALIEKEGEGADVAVALSANADALRAAEDAERDAELRRQVAEDRLRRAAQAEEAAQRAEDAKRASAIARLVIEEHAPRLDAALQAMAQQYAAIWQALALLEGDPLRATHHLGRVTRFLEPDAIGRALSVHDSALTRRLDLPGSVPAQSITAHLRSAMGGLVK